jgi:hypothetical protein
MLAVLGVGRFNKCIIKKAIFLAGASSEHRFGCRQNKVPPAFIEMEDAEQPIEAAKPAVSKNEDAKSMMCSKSCLEICVCPLKHGVLVLIFRRSQSSLD